MIVTIVVGLALAAGAGLAVWQLGKNDARRDR